jgi:hypothetical protein
VINETDGTNLYLTGGRQRPRKSDDWNAYDLAMILRVEDSGSITKAVEYVSPPEACPSDETSINFKSATITKDRLYITTNTEIMIYRLPAFERVGYLSLPWFNDVHYMCPGRTGNLFVVSTGLDMLGEITPDGKMVREWSSLGEDIWERFSREIDYRKVATTKPHRSHPNFVIETDDDVWITRLQQKDVYCLTQPERRIEFSGYPHDGVRWNGKLYFTTVNGYVHVLDEKTMTLEQTHNVNEINHENVSLGWMRGILPVSEHQFWLGFTRLRATKFRDNISWLKHGMKQFYLPTRIALVDVQKKTVLREMNLEPHGIHAVFSILPCELPLP